MLYTKKLDAILEGMHQYLPAKTLLKEHIFLKTYSPLIAQMLYNRGIETIDEAENFINPQYEANYNPFLMHHTKEWAERVRKAILNNERITIYSDYDADGIPGAVILSSFFDELSYTNYDIYIPHRHDEGYGIHLEALEKIKEQGSTLVITIDVGITAHEAGSWARANNIEIIITDHHLPLFDLKGKELLPDVDILVNPKQSACNYPDPMLCGSGVIFKCIQGFLFLYRKEFNIHEGWEKWLLDMVGIATISDMVPLRKENRLFAYFGMKVVKKTKRYGLKTLIWNSGISPLHINEEDIAFSITPKINAASRMSHPEDALAVFLAKNDIEAQDRVLHLEKLNKERKTLVAHTLKAAYKKLEKRTLDKVLVIGSPDWQAGILGLVASKLVEKYKMPCFVWSEEHGVIKGSCRTYNGHHLVDIMSRTQEKTFLQFGGHKEAGGFSCEKNEIHFLQERLSEAFEDYTQNQDDEEKNDEEIIIDTEISLTEVTKQNYQEIQKLAPFGLGNPKPLFLIRKVSIMSCGYFGKTKEHFEMMVKNEEGTSIRAMTFFKQDSDFTYKPQEGENINLLAHIEYSIFMGKHELRLKIVDILKPE